MSLPRDLERPLTDPPRADCANDSQKATAGVDDRLINFLARRD